MRPMPVVRALPFIAVMVPVRVELALTVSRPIFEEDV